VWGGKSVLVVEDDEAVRAVLAAALGDDIGAYTVVAPDGLEALKWIGRVRPTVVLLDLNLPTIDGFEVARRVKANPAIRRTCLVGISGLSPVDETRARALAAGCDHFVAKPFRIEQLLNLVHRCLVEAD
jgi:two-component system cell cycle response regulator DivK